MIQIFFIYNDWALFVLRLALAVIFIAHGWPKIKDLRVTAKQFEGMGFRPGALWGTLVALFEFFGGILLLMGLFTQIMAFILAIEIFVAAVWKISRKQKLVGGYELDLVIFAALLALAAQGSLLYGLDSFFGIYLL